MMATMRTATILLLAALPAVTSYQPNSAVPRRTFISTTGAAAAAAAASTAAPSSALAASPLVKGDESLMKAKAHGTTERTFGRGEVKGGGGTPFVTSSPRYRLAD